MEFTTEREPVKIPEQDALLLSSIRLKFLPKYPICRNLMPVSGLSDTRPGSSDQRGKRSCGGGGDAVGGLDKGVAACELDSFIPLTFLFKSSCETCFDSYLNLSRF